MGQPTVFQPHPQAVAHPSQYGDSQVNGRDQLSLWLVMTPLLAVTIFAKLALPMGPTSILVAVPTLVGALLAGIVTGRFQFIPRNLAVYLLMVGVLVTEQLFTGNEFSPTSLVLLAALHACYTVSIRPGTIAPGQQVRFFQNLATVIAVLGVIQFVAQFVVGADYAYPIEHFAPAGLITHDYNYLNPLGYGISTFKSNGVFLLEPSTLCQFMAVAVTVELVTFKRVSRLLCFGGAIVVSYSGTGLIILAITLPALVFIYRRFDILLLGLIAGALGLAFSKPLGLEVFLGRIGEFASPKSSGFERFVGGFYLFDQFLWGDLKRAFFGLGAGMFSAYNSIAIYRVAEMSWVKMISEFGIVGAITYFYFLYSCILRTPLPGLVRLALIILTLLGGIFSPWSHGLILTLAVWPSLNGPVPIATREQRLVQKAEKRRARHMRGQGRDPAQHEPAFEPRADSDHRLGRIPPSPV